MACQMDFSGDFTVPLPLCGVSLLLSSFFPTSFFSVFCQNRLQKRIKKDPAKAESVIL